MFLVQFSFGLKKFSLDNEMSGMVDSHFEQFNDGNQKQADKMVTKKPTVEMGGSVFYLTLIQFIFESLSVTMQKLEKRSLLLS